MSESECLGQVEVIVRRKALTIPDFPQTKVHCALSFSYVIPLKYSSHKFHDIVIQN